MKRLGEMSKIVLFLGLTTVGAFYLFHDKGLSDSDVEWCREFTTCEDAACCVDAQQYRGVNQ